VPHRFTIELSGHNVTSITTNNDEQCQVSNAETIEDCMSTEMNRASPVLSPLQSESTVHKLNLKLEGPSVQNERVSSKQTVYALKNAKVTVETPRLSYLFKKPSYTRQQSSEDKVL
jgi:hypothetical protein